MSTYPALFTCRAVSTYRVVNLLCVVNLQVQVGETVRVELDAFGANGTHPVSNPGGDLELITHRCHPILVALVWELTYETIDLPFGCLQGGYPTC